MLFCSKTSNPEKLAAFYQKIGLSFCFHQHGNGPFHYASEQDGFVFEIYPLLKNQLEADNSIRLGFEIKNLDQTILILEKENTPILKQPYFSPWGYTAIVKDLDGRKIELVEYK